LLKGTPRAVPDTKIMVKSPEVCFGITRQSEQVGHKNINIFSYKNLLGRFYTNGKQFI
jgi:hypothetical protein